MTPSQATSALRGQRTIPIIEASIQRVKELHTQCLAHGIAAAMIRPEVCGGG